jgi:hypothetical protein
MGFGTVWRPFAIEMLCFGDALCNTFCVDTFFQIRFVEETFCRGEVLSKRRFVEETFCRRDVLSRRGDVLYVSALLLYFYLP